MDDRYATQISRLMDAVLASPGVTDPALRAAVAARVAALSAGETPPALDLPPALDRYLTTIARHAYKITDDYIDALRQAGYSEDAIFELTLAAALGAGRRRLERGLAALRGEEQG